MKKYGQIVLFFVFALVLLTALSSAQTLITGKVYDANFNQEVTVATITVTCGSQTQTVSMTNGSFGVEFDESTCPASSAVTVSAVTSSGKKGSASNVNVTEKMVGVAKRVR